MAYIEIPNQERKFAGDEVLASYAVTLRDYFAAEAMTAIIVAGRGALSSNDAAEKAYRVSDAMLKERAKA